MDRFDTATTTPNKSWGLTTMQLISFGCVVVNNCSFILFEATNVVVIVAVNAIKDG